MLCVPNSKLRFRVFGICERRRSELPEDQDGPLPRTKRGRRSPPIGAAGAR